MSVSIPFGLPSRPSLAQMGRAGLLLWLCVVMAWAQDDSPSSLPEPPLVSWPEGVYGLHEIIVHCTDQVDGGSLRLALEVDDAQRRHLAAFSGSWWEAVLTIAAAWDLRCDMTDTDHQGPSRRVGRPLAEIGPALRPHAQLDIRSLPQINHGPWTLPVRRATPTLRPGTQVAAVASGPLLLILDDVQIIDARQASREARSGRWLGLSVRVYQCPVSLPNRVVHQVLLESSAPLSGNPLTLQFLGIAADYTPDILLPVADTDQDRLSIQATLTAAVSQVYSTTISLPPDQSQEHEDGGWQMVWHWNASGTDNGSDSLGFSIPSSCIGLSISPAPRQQPQIEVMIDDRVIPVELFRVRSIKSSQRDVMHCTIRLPPAVTDAKPLTISATISAPPQELPLSLEATVEMP